MAAVAAGSGVATVTWNWRKLLVSTSMRTSTGICAGRDIDIQDGCIYRIILSRSAGWSCERCELPAGLFPAVSRRH